jgi:DNA mismatch repair protein MutS
MLPPPLLLQEAVPLGFNGGFNGGLGAVDEAPLTSSNGKMHYQTLASFNAKWEDASPMMQQFLEVKQQYPGVVLLYRMGDFYETFLEDAVLCARLLEITLTGRDAGKLGKIPMAGIPIKAVETYLPRLLKQGLQVAICEQMEDPAVAKGLVKRQVVRVLSPGTLTEGHSVAADKPNYLAAAYVPAKASQRALPQACALAFCDVSTGAFYTAVLSYEALLAELVRIAPTELLIEGAWQAATISGLPPTLQPACAPLAEALRQQHVAFRPLEPERFEPERSHSTLLQLLGVHSLDGYGLQGLPAAQACCGAVAQYLAYSFVEALPQLRGITLYSVGDHVSLTASARRHLELLETAKDGQVEGSLLWVLNHTQSPMGSRLLREWVGAPIHCISTLRQRHNAVEALMQEPVAHQQLRALLAQVYDLERLANKVANANANPRDLTALAAGLERLPALRQTLAPSLPAAPHLLQLEGPHWAEAGQALALIRQALLSEPSVGLKEGGVFKASYHPQLGPLRTLLQEQTQWLEAYELQEREACGLRTLKVGHTPALGYYLELSKGMAAQAPPHFIRKQSLSNAERFTTEALRTHEQAVQQADHQLVELEYQLFLQLRAQLQAFAPALRHVAQSVAQVDVLQALAHASALHGYTKPELVENSLELTLVEARHPVVEKRLGMGYFVPNSCQLLGCTPPSSAQGTTQGKLPSLAQETTAPQIQIITGPNMAGKSTYMRQVALCVLLAHMGCFVPAKRARLGVIDALYTRIGAVDDLHAGQSTFMVEMTETAHILNSATPRSLVLLDEVGRGTSTYDGVAIAWSVLEHLAEQVGARTLFATHYHELNVLPLAYPQQVQNVRMVVSETATGQLAFLHKVEAGAAQKSYGVQVATMAGLPPRVVQAAQHRLNAMEKLADGQLLARKAKLSGRSEGDPQLQLFNLG